MPIRLWSGKKEFTRLTEELEDLAYGRRDAHHPEPPRPSQVDLGRERVAAGTEQAHQPGIDDRLPLAALVIRAGQRPHVEDRDPERPEAVGG